MQRRSLLLALLLPFAALAAKASWMLYQSRTDGLPLAIKWEGAVNDNNIRDLGASVDACLGRPLLATGVIHRSAVWYSGWSCDRVGNPDVIYSLNHVPRREERYYCRDGDHNNVGRYFNDDVELRDLEFLPTWDDPAMRKGACGFFADSFAELAAGKSILVHCDAGRDRTGTYAALVTALAAEVHGSLDPAMLDAIECDYRKSKSLTPAKYGRMRAFLAAVIARGGVRQFFETECAIPRPLLDAAAHRLIPP